LARRSAFPAFLLLASCLRTSAEANLEPNDLDAGVVAGGTLDSGTIDSGAFDAGTIDGGTLDAGAIDAGAWAGGPVILCSPMGLDFGLNAVGVASTLSVLCTNIRTNVPGDPMANLFIRGPSPNGQGLMIQNGDAAFDPEFDEPFPAGGLAPGKSAKINVTYAPMTGGSHADTLIISSNDPVNPRITISLVGTATVLGGCDFTLNPSNGLAFGHVGLGNSAILPFEIVNSSPDDCLVSDFKMGANSDPAFSIVDSLSGDLAMQIVPGLSNHSIYVAFAPAVAQSNFSGSVTFIISNGQRAHQSVNLTGSSLPGCLTIAPSSIDMGFVQLGQSPPGSSRRTIEFQTVCPDQDLNITSFSVVDLTTQFQITADPSPVTIPRRCLGCAPSPVTAEVSFTPLYAGVELAGIKVYTNDLADPYLLQLIGYSER
jgi:hypothetical protein